MSEIVIKTVTQSTVDRKLDAIIQFVGAVEATCRAFGLSISPEDSHGAFIVRQFVEQDIKDLKDARVVPGIVLACMYCSKPRGQCTCPDRAEREKAIAHANGEDEA